ncbi:MAG: alpha/beta hydrolase [Deltaproteobacteria bacterium]|nr:alpha/beta hydrolase [Deltaproteobacteria bacterium]
MHQQSKMRYHANGVGVHIASIVVNKTAPTLVFLPGMSGECVEGFRSLSFCCEEGFNLASLSFRGRGRSSTPDSGYTFTDHAADIDLLLRDIECNRVFLIANSISTIYAAWYLLNSKPGNVSGVVFVDHPLRVRKYSVGWADEFVKLTIDGKSVTLTMRRAAMDAMERESEEVNLYPEYAELCLPTLVMAAPIGKGLLTEADMALFERQKETSIVAFNESDHFIRLREPEKFRSEIQTFVKSLS